MPDKSLGQHWLKDRLILEAIADCVDIRPGDTVLEIGPGLGTLTSVLLERAQQVIAVEFDPLLASKLPGQFPGKNLTVYNEDILGFDFRKLPATYSVVANVPYYITSKIIHVLSNCVNPPQAMALLVQKEVAERVAATAGGMSMLSVSAQIFHDITLGPVIGAEWFTPPPKVDSQVVVMRRLKEPLVNSEDQKAFFRIVKAGFSERRKKLRSSLAGGLGMEKAAVDELLEKAGLSLESRAQELSIQDWLKLLRAM